VNSKLNIKNSTLLFPVSDLTWDQFIYPRGGKSEKTIDAYVEALAIGAQFPPIKIQRVFNYADGNETTDLPAGRHGAIIIECDQNEAQDIYLNRLTI